MLTIREIQDAIAERAPGSWEAGETTVWRRFGEADGSGLFGLRITDDQARLRAAAENFDEMIGPPPPPRVDWRVDGGGLLGPVRDQGLDCGACVAFATIATVEARHLLATGVRLELSEAELFHCNGGSCEIGWGLAAGLDAAHGGVARLADAAWRDDPKCVGAAGVVRVASFAELTSLDARRRAVARGPVVGGMQVFEDLSGYVDGIYRHVVGGFRGNHAVCVVGYDDAEGCWIARNSWGPGWGAQGCFRIAYGECKIDEMPFYSCETEAV